MPLVAALVVFSAVFWTAGWRSTVVVDGTRYHYLDDDQMISMRYARNLAEGHGLTWNVEGERVEGYTNFGWVLVMAAVHRLGASDANASLWVRGINWLLGCAVLVVTAVLLSTLGVTGPGVFAALVTLALATDLLYWAVNGFETTLLTAAFVWATLRATGDAQQRTFRATTCLLAGLLPVIRADAVDMTAAVIFVAVALGARRRPWLLSLAILPLAMHEVFRVAYYGDWLPNTYYLKVAGRSGLFWFALGNLKGFVATYTVAIVFAAAVALASADRRLRVLAVLLGFGFARVLMVGPDIFFGFRFLAPYLPVLFTVAAAATVYLTRESRSLQWMTASALLLATLFNAGINGSTRLDALVSANGNPYKNTVVGILLNRHAHHDSRVLVSAAGCLPYFSRLHAIDLLGKNDRHVARVRPLTVTGSGHNRFDVDWSLRSRPDFVATFSTLADASRADSIQLLKDSAPIFYGAALILNPIFIREYRGNPVPVPFLTSQIAIFVHAASPERQRLGDWQEPVIGRP